MGVMLGILTGLQVWGTSIDEILYIWQDMGVFRYALPFLLIFAVVFGILAKTGLLGENKGVNAVIALAVGLLALQFDFLPEFFATIFPYAGIGIAILLVGLILTGLFGSGESWWKYTFFGIGIVITLIVVLSSLSFYGWGGSWWWQDNWAAILTLIIIVALMAVVIFTGKNLNTSGKKKNDH